MVFERSEVSNTASPAVRRFLDENYTPLCESLAEVRQNIDWLDREIVRLLAERGRYVVDATRFKRDTFQVASPARVEDVVSKVRDLAGEHGLAPEVAEKIYRTMIAAFIADEQNWFARTEVIG
jgi:isochorismate pyruvate lyase